MINFTHIMQTHIPSQHVNFSDNLIDEIVQSQYNIIKYIQANPTAFVFMEGLKEDYTSDLASKNQNVALAKKVFPLGVPDNFHHLNTEQKRYICLRGGAVTLFDMGKLSAVYKTINTEQDRKISQLLSNGKFDAIYSCREIFAIQNIVEKLEEISTDNDIEAFLIYGAAHDFNKTIQKLRDAELIDDNFNVKSSIATTDADLVEVDYKRIILDKAKSMFSETNSTSFFEGKKDVEQETDNDSALNKNDKNFKR